MAIPCLCQQVWHIPTEAHPGCRAPRCCEELLRRHLPWEMRLGNAALPIAEPPPGACGVNYSLQNRQTGLPALPALPAPLPECSGPAVPSPDPSRDPGGRFLGEAVEELRSGGWGAGGSARPAGAGLSPRCWEPGSSQPSFLGHPRPTAGSALAWGEGRPPAWQMHRAG